MKRLRYQRAGTEEYWVVDLDARLVERWRPGDDRAESLAGGLVWSPGATGAILDIDLKELFADVLDR